MFNLLKILKWARQQGYNDAEQKYFHALRSRALSPIDRRGRVLERDSIETSSLRAQEIIEELTISDRLMEIINGVFVPEEKVEHKIIERKSRFLP